MRVDKSKWKIKTLSDVGTIISGSTPRTDNSLNWNNGVHNWVTPAELKGGKYYGSTAKKITDYAINHTNLTLMPIGTVLLSSRAPIGKVAITTEPMYCNQGFKNIVCNENISNDFLYYYLLYNNAELNRRGNGVTFKEISKKTVETFPVVVPLIAEQQAIAAELDAIQTMIDGYKAQIADLDVLAQSIFLDMFGDPIANPKGWEVKKLYELVKESCALTYGIVQPGDEYPNGIPVVRSIDMSSSIIRLSELKKIAPSIAEKFKRTTLVGDEIFISCRGVTGIVSLASPELKGGNITRGLVSARLEIGEKYFVYYCIKMPQLNDLIQSQTKGATLRQINVKDIRLLPIIFPPLSLQQHFATQVEAIEQQKELLRLQLKDAETLMAERMQYYFS